jgi:hypothetical protein
VRLGKKKSVSMLQHQMKTQAQERQKHTHIERHKSNCRVFHQKHTHTRNTALLDCVFHLFTTPCSGGSWQTETESALIRTRPSSNAGGCLLMWRMLPGRKKCYSTEKHVRIRHVHVWQRYEWRCWYRRWYLIVENKKTVKWQRSKRLWSVIQIWLCCDFHFSACKSGIASVVNDRQLIFSLQMMKSNLPVHKNKMCWWGMTWSLKDCDYCHE